MAEHFNGAAAWAERKKERAASFDGAAAWAERREQRRAALAAAPQPLTTRETERADELDKLTRPSARRTERADEADKQTPPRRTLKTPTGSALVRNTDSGALQQRMVQQLEAAAKDGLFQRTLPEERGSRHRSRKELSQKILHDTETAERIRNAAAGTAQGAAANAAGFLGALVAAAEKIDKQYRDEKERLGAATHADEMNPYPKTNEEVTRGNRAGVQLLEGIADTQRAKAQANTARAKEGASALGSIGIDALQIGLNLAAIVGANAVAPGAGLALMGTQSGGAAANDYRKYAAANGQEASPYAAAGLALGGLASAGAGSAAAKGALKYGGALVNRLGLGSSKIVQYALGALGDMAFSGGVSAGNEYAKAAAYGDSYDEVRISGEDLAKDMLFQAAVGFLCRTLTSSFGGNTSSAGQPERVQREYFKGIDNLDDLAKAFKQYGRKFHPDRFATASAATQRQMSDIFARISAEYNAVKAELAIETAGRAVKSYSEKRSAGTPEAAEQAGRAVENELMILKRAVENGTLAGAEAAEAVQIMEAAQGSAADSPAAGAEDALQALKSSPAQGAGYSRQRAGGPVAPSGVSATQESKTSIAPAAAEDKGEILSGGKRVDLGRYANERNAQEISRGLNDGTLAVDADNRLYRVNEGEHIDRRNSVTVGQRSMNAFQFDHPELHQYFRDAAADLAEELSYAEKGGEIIRRTIREAGDDEYFRTKRVASERIARLLDDERIGYDDIDRAVTALIHDEGQENFAAAKRVELMLDNMLTSGYTDIHGRYVAPNEHYIAAKQAIRGADTSVQTHEELPLWDLPETQNGGIYGRQKENAGGLEPAEGGGQRADAVAAAGDLYRGDRGRGSAEYGSRGAEELRSRAEKERRNQQVAKQRRAEAAMQPLTSSAALGVSGGTDKALVHVLPEERWDDELRSVAYFTQKNGVRRVTMVTGLLEVDTGAGVENVSGCIDREKGEMVLRVDSTRGTATELARHEIGHAITQERNVRAFMQEVQAGGDSWQEIYRAYERRYAALTRNYIGMTPEELTLYVWEEILEDAYAGLDSYGHEASRYHDAAVRAIEERQAAGTPARGESESLQLRAVDEPKSRGPPERFSIRRTQDIPYQEQIDAFYGGDSKTVGRSDDIYIADADNSLSALGIGEKPFFMLKSNLRKSTRIAGNNPSNSAHGISESVIRKLPELIKSPALIVRGNGRISIIPGIAIKTEKNNTAPLLIAVNPNSSVDGIDAYEIKSIYGRENFANWLDLRAKDSKIIAGDEKKAAALLRDVGKQYPEPVAYAADLTDAILSQGKSDVKFPTLGEEIRRQIQGDEAEKQRYSIEEVEGKNGTYGKGVMLDTNLFDGIRPRDWGKALSRYVYNNMAGMELTAYDAAGRPETIYLARANDRVQKDGAKNSRKVIDKLARSTGDNIRSLAVVHLDEALTTSRYENSTDEHSHQWMDENGWEYRKTYLQDRSGNIYEATLNIADGRDRKILYDINNIRLVDKAKSPGGPPAAGDSQRSRYRKLTADGSQSEAKAGEAAGGVVSSAVSGGTRSTSHSSSEERIADASGNVKPTTHFPTLGEEIRRQMQERSIPRIDGSSAANSGALRGDASADSLSRGAQNVKFPTLGEEIRRQIMGEEEKASAASTSVGGITEGAKASGEVTPAIDTAHDGSIADKRGNVKYSLDEQRAEDEAYLSLAKDPKRNRGKLQEMVNAAAERAGYDSPDLYHGTRAFGFTEFDLAKMDDGTSIFLTTNPTVAGTYTSADAENTNLETLYRNPKSPADRGNPLKRVDAKSALLGEVIAAWNREADALGAHKYRAASHEDVLARAEREIGEEAPRMAAAAKRYAEETDGLSLPVRQYLKRLSDLGNYSGKRLYEELFILKETESGFEQGSRPDREMNAFVERTGGIPTEMAALARAALSDGAFVEYVPNGRNVRSGHPARATEAKFREFYQRQAERENGIYKVRARLQNPLVIDAQGAAWSDVGVYAKELALEKNANLKQLAAELGLTVEDSGSFLSKKRSLRGPTRSWSQYAKSREYDGVIFKNLYDPGTDVENDANGVSDVYIVFDPAQVKSTEAVTYDDSGRAIPLSERFDARERDIRYSADDERDGEWDEELARLPDNVREAVERMAGRDSMGFRKEDFPNLDQYLSARSSRLAAEKAERLRNKDKDEFDGTEALKKLGVRIENSAGDYSNVRQLVENDKAAKQIRKETRKAIQRLSATPKEQVFAMNISSGVFVPSDIPRGLDREKVMELADYYAAERAMSNDLIRARRSEITDRLQEKMEDLFDEKFEGEFTNRRQKKGVAPESGLALYHRTPQRSMRAIFGWERGQKINEAIFEPVYVNEQERKRFVNRMHNEVRTFTDENGRESPLTRRERAMTQLVIEGKAVEELVGKNVLKNEIIHAAENLKGGAEMKDVAREFSLSEKERDLAERYAGWLRTQEELADGSVDRAKIENAAEAYTALYDQFYSVINDFLVAHGYEPIGFIKGYAPHFQPEAESGKLERALKAIGVDLGAEVGKLPASIAGLTKEFKPNKRYNPFFQHRNGGETDIDIQKGFEKYVDYLSDILYHTDDIMRVRAASKYFRRKYAPDEISAQLEQAEELRFATPEEKELFLKTNRIVDEEASLSYEAMNEEMAKYVDGLFGDIGQTTKYGDLVTWMDDYANKLAGKQLFNDRSMEREVGRTSLNVGRRLVNAFARANVAGNLSSALNQTAQLPMIAGELGAKYVAEAIGDIARGEVKGDFAARSDFLTEKHGIDYLTSTKGGQITEKLFWPLERMDYLISSIAVRGKYRKELAEGKSEKDALRAADRWGRDIMGSRSKGTAPLTFQSKSLLSQMVNLFQVEALNSWEHVTQDLFGEGLREAEAKLGRNEAARRLAGVIVGTLLGAFLLNRVDEELYGGTPAPFDVLGLLTGFLASGNGLSTNEQLGVWVDDVWQKMTGERLFGTDEDAGSDEFNLGAATEDTLYNISNDVPYVRNVSGVLGLGDETLPMPDIAGTVKGVGGTISKQASGDFDGPGDFWSEVGRQLMGLAGDTLPGGRQAEKSAQGIETLARGGSYRGGGDNRQLQYPVDIDPYTALRAALFGKNALSEARTYWAAGGVALSAKETRAYEDLVDSGMSRKDAYDTLLKLKKMTAGLTADLDKDGEPISGSKKEKVLRAIHSLPLSRKQKDLLYLGEGYSEKGLEDAPWH